MIPIPLCMRHLPLDPRGYPIPYVVLRDANGGAHFTVNDDRLTERCRRLDLCPICGDKLFRGRWFVGGPASAFDPNGAYLDTGMHDECAHYALRACPYLAAPKYSRRLEGATLKGKELPSEVPNVFIDGTVDPERPKFFVAVMAIGQTWSQNGPWFYAKPKRPYRKVEFWRHGLQISSGF